MRLSADQVRYLRLRAQLLTGSSSADAARVTELVAGIQAQDAAAAGRGIWTRSQGLTAAQVEQARVKRRSIVRTWAMRGTLHLLPSEALSTIYSAFGLRFIRTSKRRYEQLGLTEEVMAEAVQLIDRVLAEFGPLTRGEIAGQLAKHNLPHEGQIAFHLIRRAAFLGLLCYGPERAGDTAFVRVSDWLDSPVAKLDSSAATANLCRWYLRSFGPAGAADFSAWSGLPITQARQGLKAIAGELVKVELDREPLWMLADRTAWLEETEQALDHLRLLPAFDSYLLGYRNRELSVPELFADGVHPGGGIIRPTVLVGGQAAGIWSARQKGRGLEVGVQLFRKLGGGLLHELEGQIADLGRFHDVQVISEIRAPSATYSISRG